MKLFDAHCHLLPPEAFERAAAAGVERMACCGTSSNDWNKVFQLSAEYPQVIPMIGIHPWFVGCRAGAVTPPGSEVTDLGYNWEQDFQTLGKLLRENPGAGIGETGLDFSSFAKASAAAEAMADKTADRQERFTNRAEQEASFIAHLDLARELNRPVAVHCVHAWGRLIEILREHPAPRVLLHAFSGAAELIPELVELNCWFSFCGSVTNPNAKRMRDAAAAVPEDRLLIETDAPDFSPVGCEPPNEPANLIHVARAVAEIRGVSVEAIADCTFFNSAQVFDDI